MKKKEKDEIQDMIWDALFTDGGHHKQWYLEQIAIKLKLDLPDKDLYEEGIAP